MTQSSSASRGPSWLQRCCAASFPFSTAVTSYPARSNVRTSSVREIVSSSATRILIIQPQPNELPMPSRAEQLPSRETQMLRPVPPRPSDALIARARPRRQQHVLLPDSTACLSRCDLLFPWLRLRVLQWPAGALTSDQVTHS